MPVVDVKVLAGLIGDDPRMIRVFLHKFLNSVPDNIGDIRKSLDRGDFKAVKSYAHKLKSSAAAIGAVRMAKICVDIENSIANVQGQDGIALLINELDNELLLCRDYIDKY